MMNPGGVAADGLPLISASLPGVSVQLKLTHSTRRRKLLGHAVVSHLTSVYFAYTLYVPPTRKKPTNHVELTCSLENIGEQLS